MSFIRVIVNPPLVPEVGVVDVWINLCFWKGNQELLIVSFMLDLLRSDLKMALKKLPIFLSAVVFCLLQKYLWNDDFILCSMGRVVNKTGLILVLMDFRQE